MKGEYVALALVVAVGTAAPLGVVQSNVSRTMIGVESARSSAAVSQGAIAVQQAETDREDVPRTGDDEPDSAPGARGTYEDLDSIPRGAFIDHAAEPDWWYWAGRNVRRFLFAIGDGIEGVGDSWSDDTDDAQLDGVRARFRRAKEQTADLYREGIFDLWMTVSDGTEGLWEQLPEDVRQRTSAAVTNALEAGTRFLDDHPTFSANAGFAVGFFAGIVMQTWDMTWGTIDAGAELVLMTLEGRGREIPGMVASSAWNGLSTLGPTLGTAWNNFFTALKNDRGFEDGVVVGRGTTNVVTALYVLRKPAAITGDLVDHGVYRLSRFLRTPTGRRVVQRITPGKVAPPRLSKHVPDEHVMQVSGLSWEELLKMQRDYPWLANEVVLRAETVKAMQYAAKGRPVPKELLERLHDPKLQANDMLDAAAQLRLARLNYWRAEREAWNVAQLYRDLERTAKVPAP